MPGRREHVLAMTTPRSGGGGAVGAADMRKEQQQDAIKVTIVKLTGDQWMIRPSDKREMGPYRSSLVALQVAATEVLVARKHGGKADMFVQDDYADVHLCAFIDHAQGTDHCRACEESWVTSRHPLPPRCPLWSAFRGH